ncbi:MAG: diguanylate cyclase protein [Gammaproteobacteria bacterium]|nr:diguanylate cyclase protein [Gammaproteobacteria bacterium]
MWPRRATPRSTDSRAARRYSPGGIGLALLVVALAAAVVEQPAAAFQPAEAAALLQRADRIKTSDPAGFAALLDSLEDQSNDLTAPQQEFVRYLRGWKSAYDGEYETALARLESTIRETHDVTLKFRANASIIHILLMASHYEEAFTHLTQLLVLLPKNTDLAAREQGLVVASQLYNEVGQYDLGINYSQKVIDENWLGRGICKGSDQKLRAEVASGKVRSVGPEFAAAIEACTQLNELAYANYIRTYEANVYIANNQVDEGIRLLTEHYPETLRSGFRHLISRFESLLAEAYQKKGDVAAARQFAARTIASAVPDEVTEPLVVAYRLLYEQARQAGDFKSALEYHEKYAAADKGYLDVTTARQLAYQRVAHESVASRLQIEALNKENHVLQLEQALGAKAVENSRLYIMLLLMIVGFVGFWAYRTKRLQLHFMSLSQIDGLTGIANRPHFLHQAQEALESARKAQQPLCIILCDLDHFKSINDKYGHAAGDQVLRQTVAECQIYMRPADLFGRFGGEEFSFLMAGCGLETARLRAEQLRLTLAGISANGAMGSPVSASFGIASTAASGYDLRQLLAHADSALYAAKRSGRNCVVVYDTTVAIMGASTPAAQAAASAELEMADAQILGIAGS